MCIVYDNGPRYRVISSAKYRLYNKYHHFTTENVELLTKNKNVIIIFDVKAKIYTVKVTVKCLRYSSY